MKRALSVVAAVSVLIPFAAASGTAAPVSGSHRLAITGYALGGTSAGVIAASAQALTTVTVDGVSISADGAHVDVPDSSLASVRRIAHQHGLRTELLVDNYSNDLGDFDPKAAHALLSNHANVLRLARTMAGYVTRGHYDGANIDLELVQPRDAVGLVDFAQALQSAMPARKTVSIDVSAEASLSDYRGQGYLLGRLGRAVDVVQLMAYDEHGPTWSGPGPIGDLRWQKQALGVLLTKVAARKVDLGQAGYGYTWPTSGVGVTVTDRGARARVARDGATAIWHPASGEWSATLSNGTRMWWADRRSYAIRKDLARARHLHGMAVWVLGSADPLK